MGHGRSDRRPEAVHRRARRRAAANLVVAGALASLVGCAVAIGLDRLLGP